MTERVVVVGSGYAGTGTVQSFAKEIRSSPVDAELVWISERDYHLVLHEVHRVIRDPSVAEKVALPVDVVAPDIAEFRQGRVVDVDTETRTLTLDDGDAVDYDYLMLGVGSQTAFYGIDGLREHSLTLKGLEDAREIHEEIAGVASAASRTDPATVVVGGAGLSGIQAAGEIAGYRDDNDAFIDVSIVEGLDDVFPGNPDSVQSAIRARLEERDIDVLTGDFISEVDTETIYLGGSEDEPPVELDYDVLLWTGGITGQDELAETDLDQDERSHRLFVESDFRTSDDRVLAIGDTALVSQGDDDVAPPTAQAAWQAADVAGENLVRLMEGKTLRTWTYEDKGTLISVGHDAVAHDVKGLPWDTFGGLPAKVLKKAIAARWIASISSLGRAGRAWSDM